MNRFLKRLERFGKTFSARRSQGLMSPSGAEDVPNVRAGASGHGKKTADKWNQ